MDDFINFTNCTFYKYSQHNSTNPRQNVQTLGVLLDSNSQVYTGSN